MHSVDHSAECWLVALTCMSFFFFVLRMVDDLHRLVKASEIAAPFILVGSELGALNGRFYTHIYDA